MKNLLFYCVLVLIPFLISSDYPASSNQSLADEVAGIYTGMFAKDGSLTKGYKIKVTKVTDNIVIIAPEIGGESKTFKAKLREDNLTAIRVIRLEAIDNLILKNGMITPLNGRLSYGISVREDGALEVFSGLHQRE